MMGILFGFLVLIFPLFNFFEVFMWTDFLIILMLIPGKLNIIGWNCRESIVKDMLNRLQRIMKDNFIDIIALVETRADDERVYHLCSKFAKSWNWVALLTEGY